MYWTPFALYIYLFIYVATADPACKNLTIKTDFFPPLLIYCFLLLLKHRHCLEYKSFKWFTMHHVIFTMLKFSSFCKL